MSRYYNDELMHYGIKGMKWGKRKPHGATWGREIANERIRKQKFDQLRFKVQNRNNEGSLRNQGYSSSRTPMDGDKLKQLKSLTKKAKKAKRERNKAKIQKRFYNFKLAVQKRKLERARK